MVTRHSLRNTPIWLAGLVAVGMAISACSVDPLDVASLEISIVSGPKLVSSSTPGSYEIQARNPTDARVEWGVGSSGCQLSLFVITPEGERLPADVMRGCTEDFTLQALSAGQTRTETIEWGGQALVNNEVVTLPNAVYRLVASAGDRADSAPYEVQVVTVLAADN